MAGICEISNAPIENPNPSEDTTSNILRVQLLFEACQLIGLSTSFPHINVNAFLARSSLEAVFVDRSGLLRTCII